MPLDEVEKLANLKPESYAVLQKILRVIREQAITDGDLSTALAAGTKTFRIENRTSDPSSPTTGQIWFRTDV
jgi:hypothetical protein